MRTVLVVCTANQCRSPMAQALLQRRLPGLAVRSAGSISEGVPPSGGSVRAMALRGLDIDGHRSRRLTRDEVGTTDLVVGLARAHLREVVAIDPPAFRRTFTLREVVRRGEAGARPATYERWLDALNDGRRAAGLLGDHPDDDVADPMGRPDYEYEATATILDDLVERLAVLLEPYVDPPA